MSTNWKAPVLALLGLAAIAVAVPVSIANAQQGTTQNTQGQAGQETRRTLGQATLQDPQNQRFRGADAPPQEMRPDMQRGMMMGGGPATMVVDNQFLYILQGNMLFKVNKNTLETVATGMLPMPQPRFGDMPGGGPGAPGVRSGGAAAGGGVSRSGGAAGGGGTAK